MATAIIKVAAEALAGLLVTEKGPERRSRKELKPTGYAAFMVLGLLSFYLGSREATRMVLWKKQVDATVLVVDSPSGLVFQLKEIRKDVDNNMTASVKQIDDTNRRLNRLEDKLDALLMRQGVDPKRVANTAPTPVLGLPDKQPTATASVNELLYDNLTQAEN